MIRCVMRVHIEMIHWPWIDTPSPKPHGYVWSWWLRFSCAFSFFVSVFSYDFCKWLYYDIGRLGEKYAVHKYVLDGWKNMMSMVLKNITLLYTVYMHCQVISQKYIMLIYGYKYCFGKYQCHLLDELSVHSSFGRLWWKESLS